MAPTRMIDFLKAAETFHEQLSNYYREKCETARNEDVKTLLVHLSRHEDNVQDMILRYEEGADLEILNAWFKVSPDFSLLKSPCDLEINPEDSADDIIRLAIEMDNSLIDMYKLLVRESLADDVKDALNNLIQEEIAEKIKLMGTS